jgi:hypothetical protein
LCRVCAIPDGASADAKWIARYGNNAYRHASSVVSGRRWGGVDDYVDLAAYGHARGEVYRRGHEQATEYADRVVYGHVGGAVHIHCDIATHSIRAA